MKPSKIRILYYFLKFRWSRIFSSNQVGQKLIRLWKENLKRSDFYKKYLESGQSFPAMDKTSFMENFNQINTVDIKKSAALELAIHSELSRDFSPSINNISIGLSSGTSGNKGIFLTSKEEKEKWVGAVLDRVIGLSFKKRRVAFFLRANNNLYESVNSSLLEFNFFDIKNSIKSQIEKLIDLKANILVAQPSVLLEIARNYEAQNISPNFQKIISVAEVLENDQKIYFEKVFNCPISQVYQCTEGFLAYTCKKGNLHFNEDWLKIEKKYLDDSQTRFHPVITDYLRTSQPVIRYELNDIIHEGSPCTCGSNAMVIDRIEGRSDDVFRFNENGQDIVIYPDFIRRAIINTTDKVLNYTITKKSKKTIELFLEVANFNDEATQTKHFTTVYTQVKHSLNNLFTAFGLEQINIIQGERKSLGINKFKRINNEC